MFGFMSFADLARDINRGIDRIPAVDMVVGIPRSGMIPAYMIGLYKQLGVLDLAGFIAGNAVDHGSRQLASQVSTAGQAQSILLVDDSLYSGSSMHKAIARIREAGYQGKITTCAAVIEPSQKQAVDVYFRIMQCPRCFEWNALHHSLLANACVDLDGVLCVDPTPEENDDGPRYRSFLANAALRIRPSGRIGHIVSARLEKYRGLTEQWLAANHIEFGKLHLVDLPSAQERVRRGVHALHKANVYKSTETVVFFESDDAQSAQIARLAEKPVVCTTSMKLYTPPLASWPMRQVLRWKFPVPVAHWRRLRSRLYK